MSIRLRPSPLSTPASRRWLGRTTASTDGLSFCVCFCNGRYFSGTVVYLTGDSIMPCSVGWVSDGMHMLHAVMFTKIPASAFLRWNSLLSVKPLQNCAIPQLEKHARLWLAAIMYSLSTRCGMQPTSYFSKNSRAGSTTYFSRPMCVISCHYKIRMLKRKSFNRFFSSTAPWPILSKMSLLLMPLIFLPRSIICGTVYASSPAKYALIMLDIC